MPCVDGREKEDQEKAWKAECILCAVLRKHGYSVLMELDYVTMGLSPAQVLEWVQQHRAEDYAKLKI